MLSEARETKQAFGSPGKLTPTSLGSYLTRGVFTIDEATIAGLEARAGIGQAPEPESSDPATPPAPGPLAPHPDRPSPPTQPRGDVALRGGAVKGLLMATAGLVVGGLVGGPLGAAAGVAGVGALRNSWRAKDGWADPDPEIRAEAGKSATMAIFGYGISGMLIYQAWKEDDD